jgi:hypothetical protein
MKWPSWRDEKRKVALALQKHARLTRPLPGVVDSQALDTLATQFVASLRRERYYELLQTKSISAHRANPNDLRFEAERAVAYHVQQRNIDEAAWLIFLMTHFARPTNSGWTRLQDVYGRLGTGIWDWNTVSKNPAEFKDWLAANWRKIRGKFGNHRKYESLRPTARRNLARVVDSYLAWVGSDGHRQLFADVVRRTGNDPHKIFETLYQEIPIVSFGRLARFDYLSMLGRYGIAPIEAGSAYLDGATGPLMGAHLLFDGTRDGPSTINELQCMLDGLDKDLSVGMKVIEDALCNWQKSPLRFEHFTG